jgi:uracil-DNA glycosylase
MKLDELLVQIRDCTVCAGKMPVSPRPIVRAHPHARVLIVGQAPGRKVRESGVPWDDVSGETLRDWLAVSRDAFYDPTLFAIVPMGFCYPGSGRSGDLPPRSECAPLWHEQLLAAMPDIKLTILTGRYAQSRYLADKCSSTLTETVRRFAEFLPAFFPLPHPSPRNRIWMARNPWFEAEVLPHLQATLEAALRDPPCPGTG